MKKEWLNQKSTMQFQPKKIIYLRFGLLALFISACALYYSYPNIQKKVSNSIILKRSCLKKKITDISTFLQDRSENFNLQNEDCKIISSTMDQIFDLGEKLVLFCSSQNLRLWVNLANLTKPPHLQNSIQKTSKRHQLSMTFPCVFSFLSSET